jgi:hypothetical protein
VLIILVPINLPQLANERSVANSVNHALLFARGIGKRGNRA